MIRFNCHCTHEFLVPEDQAGGMVQCPKCGRLNDVPLLSDLQNLEADGLFKIGDAPQGPSKKVLPTATRAFTRDVRDESGEDIDMRHNVEEFLNIGAEEVPLELADQERPGAPKYDPLTGELVETLDIKPASGITSAEAKAIPIATRAVQYASGDVSRRVTPGTILLALFQPVNLFVMIFVILAHLLLQCTMTVVEAGIFFAAPVLIIIGGLIVAHYGIVIEEIGTVDADELPRPLRNAALGEDLWGPFIRFNLAILLCFWPVIFQANMTGPIGMGLLVSCVAFGIFFFPAVLMTALIAGSYLNLRFDRIVGVIRACGRTYWSSVIAFAFGGAVYLGAIGFVDNAVSRFFGHDGMKIPLIRVGIGSPALMVGIYLFHFACWHLGLLYRANHERFPWVLQRHVISRRTDMVAQLEAARRAAQQLDALRAHRPDRDQRVAELRANENARQTAANQPAPGEKPIWDRVAETRND